MPTAEELKTFLAKRGYSTEVGKTDNTFTIGISSKTVDEVSKLVGQIEEPGRFIISVFFSDVADLLYNKFGIQSIVDKEVELKSSIENLEKSMSRNTELLTKTDEELKKQNENSISGLEKKVLGRIGSLDVQVAKLEKKKPWYKKLVGK
jgi:hypothetical protein